MRSTLRTRRWRAASGLAAVAVGLAVGLAACGGDDADAGAGDGPKVVAATGWVAAIARLAGAGEITIIAPSSVQHPPDYEPRASDLEAVADADFVLLAGFEGFAEQLTEAAGGDAKVLTVATTYDPAKLAAEIEKLGAAMGTAEAAAESAPRIAGELTAVCADLKERLGGATPVVVAHAFVVEWAACAGLAPVGTFGPAPITPGEVDTLAKAGPTLVLENRHMAGSGEAIAGATGAKLVDLVNLPDDASLDLVAVARQDADAIAAAVAP